MRRIEGVVRDYDWGRSDAIADLLGRPAPGHPEAEYWLGTHPGGPATALAPPESSGAPAPMVGLDELVAGDPESALGQAVVDRFGDLPFLLKVLAADRPLSIQAHPDLDQARAGFADEEQRGVQRDAPDRNYRDPNHKPELICALTPFEAKCGFRSTAESHRLFAALAVVIDDGSQRPMVDDLLARLAGGDGQPEDDARVLSGITNWLLGLPADQANALAEAVTEAAARLGQRGGDSTTDFSVELEWTGRIAEAFPGDVGVVVALLLNHVTLSPGQAIFLEAGNLHSYLSGVGVELMANSDNVLRGGLTSKHVDPGELLRVVDHRPSRPPVQVPQGPIHTFDVPVAEFSLTRIATSTESGEPLTMTVQPAGPEIVLVTDGRITLVADRQRLEVDRGGAVFVPARCSRYEVMANGPEPTVAWRAATGLGPVPGQSAG